MNNKPPKIRKNPLFFKKTLAAVLCHLVLVMSTLGWAAAETRETSIRIPVQTTHVPTGMVLTGPPVQGIEIEINGPAQAVHSLTETKLNYELNLSDRDLGIHTIAVVIDQIKLPEGIAIVKLNTPSITIRIDREIKKEVPVAVVVNGDPAPGYQVADSRIDPDKVVLRGPEMVLTAVEKISTNPIDCTGAEESFKRKITLNLPENVSILLPTDPIIAQVEIQEQVISRVFQECKVAGRNSKHVYHITPPVIRIKVKGPYSVVNDLENHPGFEIFVDLEDLKPGVYVRRATIALPITTVLSDVSPEIFTVKIGAQ